MELKGSHSEEKRLRIIRRFPPHSRDRPQDEGKKQSLPLAFRDRHQANHSRDVYEGDVDGHGPIDGLILPVVHSSLHRVLRDGDRVEG